MITLKKTQSKIILFLLMLSVGMGVFAVSINSNLSFKALFNDNIQLSKKSKLSYSTKLYSFPRKPYQKRSKSESYQRYKNTKNITMPFNNDLLAQVETEKFSIPKAKKLDKVTSTQKHHPLNSKVKKTIKQKKFNKAYVKAVPPKRNTINITEQLIELQKIVNDIDAKPKKVTNKKQILTNVLKSADTDNVDYWQTVYSIESKQGKLLYRPRNKAKNCDFTLDPCGHHQLTVQALRDIGCKSLQCRKDRLDFKKSLALSKKLLALNEMRLKNDGLTNLRGYQKYLIHQQGANGIKNIIAATKGKKQLSKTIKKNMANNSPYSYKQFKKMGSKVAAKKFMRHWEKKWMNEKRMILASNTKSSKRQINTRTVPTFNDNDLNFALNMMF